MPWQQAREGVEVKLLAEDGELYVLAKSQDRVNKERAMRRRQLKRLWKRLRELQEMELERDALLMKLGAARQQAPERPGDWSKIKRAAREATTKLEFSLRKNRSCARCDGEKAAICCGAT